MLPSNYKPETKDCSQQLRYHFNNEELIERGKKLSETHSKLGQLELDKKRVVTDFTAKVSAVKSEATSLAEMVSTGYEVRDIACTATMDTPTIGKKRVTRNDTGEEVAIEPMTPSENSSAQDARAKAEYDLKNPVLDLENPAIAELGDRSEADHNAEANAAANPENNLPESNEAAPPEEESPDGEEAPPAKKKAKKASKPSDEF